MNSKYSNVLTVLLVLVVIAIIGIMFEALNEALKEVKIVMNDKEFGTFVIDTMERAVYS